jgi:predicted cupin superfamily sugar epimerase
LLDGKQGQFSAFHKLGCDEMWHFYDGSSLTLYVINDNADLSAIKLGNNLENGECLQISVRAGSWFGATVNDQSSYTLVGCTCSPAFDYQDFELAKRKELHEMYPQHKSIIEKLTRS